MLFLRGKGNLVSLEGENQLVPFVFQWSGGYLVGKAALPSEGSPCSSCFELWLVARKIAVTRLNLGQFRFSKEVLPLLELEKTPHVIFEVTFEGQVQRLDCVVFPHPQCSCSKDKFKVPASLPKKANFSFSPLFQIKCARYSLPKDNMWLACTSGNSPLTNHRIQVLSAASDREIARWGAYDVWLKKVILDAENSGHLKLSEMEATDFRTSQTSQLADLVGSSVMNPKLDVGQKAIGTGKTYEEAVINGLCHFAKKRTIEKYIAVGRSPLLIVGSNNWIHQKLPFFVLQQYDVHLFFYPNSTPSWTVGVAAVSRTNTTEAPFFAFGCSPSIQSALDEVLGKVLEHCRPADWESGQDWQEEKPELAKDERNKKFQAKLGQWWTHWIYRCAKISLKEILHLEDYPKSISLWKDYFNDGQESLTVVKIQHPLLPESIRHVVKIISPTKAVQAQSSNVRMLGGVGTMSSFRDGLTY
jgi:hypothetical protein